jgi:hypothetical protein
MTATAHQYSQVREFLLLTKLKNFKVDHFSEPGNLNHAGEHILIFAGNDWVLYREGKEAYWHGLVNGIPFNCGSFSEVKAKLFPQAVSALGQRSSH